MMRRAALLMVLVVGISIIVPSCNVIADTTPTIGVTVVLDNGNVTVTLVAFSKNDVKPEDTRIILDPPDRDASLLSFPRGSIFFNDTLEITALPSTSSATHPYLQPGDSIRITNTEHSFALGDWMVFLIYLPTQYSMGWRAWGITVDIQGHQQIGPSNAALPTDPMTYYGFRTVPWEFEITEADLSAFLLIAYVAVLGMIARRRLKRDKT